MQNTFNKMSISPIIYALEISFDYLNERFYEGKLKRPVIVVAEGHKSRAMGWFSCGEVWHDKDGNEHAHELNVAGDYLDRSFEEVATTLDCMEELQLVRARYDERDEDGRAIRPNFFAHVAKKKGYYDAKKKNYKKQLAPMDFVQEIVDLKKWNKNTGKQSALKGSTSIGEIFENVPTKQAPRTGYTDLVISMIRNMNIKTKMVYQTKDSVANGSEKRKLASEYFKQCIESIKTMHLSSATMQELLVAMDQPENADIKRKLWSIIFGALGVEFTCLLKEAKSQIKTIEECASGEDGDIKVFWLQFKYKNIA